MGAAARRSASPRATKRVGEGGGAETGQMAVFGPYGIATTPDGQVFFASLAGNYLGQIDVDTDGVTVLEPPMPHQGSRRI